MYYNPRVVNFAFDEINSVALRLHPKIKNFRTFLEIYSFELAGKPTDSNLIYYTIR